MTARFPSRSDPRHPSGPPTSGDEPVLFFDAGCGLCDRAVRLLLRADRRQRLRFAAIGGATWDALVPEEVRGSLPDTALLRLADGRLLARSAAILGALHEAGGPWAALADLGRLVPRVLADRLYDAVARRRRGVVACPLPAPASPRFLP
jgi:predicted DCC family thiol-disulfide oxidoreductase YuxK